MRHVVSEHSPFVRRPRSASFTVWRAPSSPLARRLALATAAAALIACRADSLTEPTRLAPSAPDLLLVGGAGTPIFPTATPGEPQAKGFAIGLNAAGQVTGGAHDLFTSEEDRNEPFRWSPGGALVKLACCYENGFGADINASGVVVGSVEATSVPYRAFVATGNSITLLPVLPGLSYDEQDHQAKALAINDAGDIVGFSPAPAYRTHAVRWSASGAITDLGTLGGSNSGAVDINNSGQIIGMSQTAGDAATHAFLWSPGSGMQDLNVLTGLSISDVVEINDAGQIIGTTLTQIGFTWGFLYTPGSGLRILDGPGNSSAPTGLNGRGDVVGWARVPGGENHAALWTASDGFEDITLLTGLTDIRRLNDNMQTLTVTAPPAGTPGVGKAIPRLVQLYVTQLDSPPIAVFTWSCNGLTCTLDASGSIDDKPGLTYTWDLNKNPEGSATGAIVTVTYPHSNPRTVTLTVTDSKGQSSTGTQTLPVSDYPIAAFTYACTGLTCTFDSNGSTNGGNPISNHVWYFGDTQVDALDRVTTTHTYQQPGTYTVKLEVFDHSGIRGVVTQQITVRAPNQPPVASFTSSCTGTVCTLDASGSTDDRGIVSYSWILGKYPDGTASGVSVTTDYWHTSTRTVTLTVTDADGATNSITQTFDVAPTSDAPPIARFTESCTGTVCTFDASTSSDDVGITSYAWSLGKYPDDAATGVTVTTDYWHTSTRTVTLTVTDTKGQTNSVTHTLTIP